MSLPRIPRAVCFDLDGLMFNTEDLYREVGSRLLQRRGKEFTPELIAATMGRPARVVFEIMIEWHGLTDSSDVLGAESAEVFEGLLDGRLAPMPGLPALLDALETAAIPKSIATSSSWPQVRSVLSRFQYETRFEFVLTAEDVQNGKPHPEIYLVAADRLGVEPGELLVLEDSQAGCSAAIAAGTIAVAVPADHSRTHDFSGASLVIDNLADPRLYQQLRLPQVLDSIGE